MLSRKSGQLYQAVLKWCNTYGGMPFIWHNRRGKVTLSNKSNIRWRLAISFQLLSGLFITWRIWQIISGNLDNLSSSSSSHLDPDHDHDPKSPRFDIGPTYCIIYAMIHVYSAMVFLNTIGKCRELVLFINSYLKFTKHFREAYTTRLPRSWHNGCEEWVQIVISISVLVPLIPTIHFLRNPLHPQFFPSILLCFDEDLNYDAGLRAMSSRYGVGWMVPLVGGFVTFQVFFVWSVLAPFLFMTVNAIISAYVFSSAIKEMTMHSPEGNPFPVASLHHHDKRRSRYQLVPNYVTKDKLRQCYSLVKCYRCFQLTQTLAHQAFSDLAFAVEFLEICFNSGSFIILLRFWGEMTSGSGLLWVVWIGMCTLLWTGILSILGQFEERTRRCVQSWKYVKYNYVEEIRYMKLVKKSCGPIVISAKFFRMRIRHVPRFLYAIVCGVILWNEIYELFRMAKS